MPTPTAIAPAPAADVTRSSGGTAGGVTGRPTLRPMREPEALSPRLRVRRAAYLILVTLLVPGSAQLAAGSRRAGRIVTRAWLAVLAALAVLGLLWLVDRTVVLRLATSPLALGALTVGCFLAAAAWSGLVVDAWRLGRPRLLPRRSRLAMTGLLVVSVALAGLPLVAAGQRTWAAADLITGVFGSGQTSDAVAGRFNVLLLGGDAGADRTGTRPDSMTLVSIDSQTGRSVLFSLPRNLENVPFPAGSAAAKALPKGWACGDKCLLNAIYTWGTEHKALFPAAADPGAEAMKEAIEGVTGLTVNYYVLIDLKGFRRLIDAMGGITVTVGTRVPIGGETSRISGYIEPGTQKLDGYHALWFARSRTGASDYARMQRQRCVMNAMLHQLDPATLLSHFQGIAAAGKDVMSTDIPAGELATFIDLGTAAKSQKVTSVQFVPPLVNPAYPDYTVIHSRVAQAIAESEHPGTASAVPSPHASAASQVRASAVPSASGSPAPTSPVDITAACTAG